jgi:TetR/AcrR family transcriptional regulator, regulator of autoinduction and epiphytic fitness
MITSMARSVNSARENRSRMLLAARELFVAQGYADTTMDQIAAAAGVSVQTVYYRFHTKAKLLVEVTEATARGSDEPVRPEPPAWLGTVLGAGSPQEVLELGIRHGTAIYDRVAQLWPAMAAAAASDGEVGDYWRGVTERRRSGQAAMVGRIAELGGLREDLDADRATDLVVVLLGHDVYRGLVIDSDWPPEVYRAEMLTLLSQQLLRT